ncbi:MAG: GNAT family N-acetyltransferase [Oscillospiraceae bacterium]|nr:GNAT family N-acetyltransferase [Oscillospiraceae bacterium]
MLLRHGELCIRNAEPRDAARLAAWWNDGRVMAHAGFPLGLGVSEEEVAKQLASGREESGRVLLIAYQDRPIGEMNYRNLGDGTAEIGIKICESAFQNRGLGRALLSLLIRALFERGYSRIVLDTNLKNVRAQHVYELLGFEKLRVNENSWRDQLGESQSSVDYALTPDRFRDHAR